MGLANPNREKTTKLPQTLASILRSKKTPSIVGNVLVNVVVDGIR